MITAIQCNGLSTPPKGLFRRRTLVCLSVSFMSLGSVREKIYWLCTVYTPEDNHLIGIRNIKNRRTVTSLPL